MSRPAGAVFSFEAIAVFLLRIVADESWAVLSVPC
jgi:hypothetical protein